MRLSQAILSFIAATAPLMLHAEMYTARTAPDAVSVEVLANSMTRLDQGPLQAVDASAQIHANFPQIIEQNFAALSAQNASELFDSLSAAELSDLAQLYVNAVAESGAPPRLLAVLTHRLDAKRLWRLSQFFGYGPVRAAIAKGAPKKMSGFLSRPRVPYEGPVIGDDKFGPQGRFLHDGTPRTQLSGTLPISEGSKTASAIYRGTVRFMKASSAVCRGNVQGPTASLTRVAFGQFLHYTPYEVYMSFRTAPGYAALGVAGALWETSVVLSSTLTVAYATGYAIGTNVVKPLVQTYAPSLYDGIGSTIGSIVNTLTNSWSSTTQAQAVAQRDTASAWTLGAGQSNFLQTTGGDFGSAFQWHSAFGGGGACGNDCYDTDPFRKPSHAGS